MRLFYDRFHNEINIRRHSTSGILKPDGEQKYAFLDPKLHFVHIVVELFKFF